MGSARTAPRRRADRTATLIAASLGFGVIQLDVTVVNVAVKPIGEALGGGTAALQWVVSSYTLLFASLILTGGALGDRFGVRRMLSLGFVLFVAASMACGLAPSIGALIAGRALQGVGAALLGACSLALINHTFHAEGERSRAVALWAAGATVALSGGPIVGGVLIAALGWRSIFFIMTLVILVANLVASRIAARIGRRGVLWLGLALMALGCVGLLPTDASTPFGVIVVPQVLLGAGLGLLVRR